MATKNLQQLMSSFDAWISLDTDFYHTGQGWNAFKMIDVRAGVVAFGDVVFLHNLSIDQDVHFATAMPLLLTEIVLHCVITDGLRRILKIDAEGLVVSSFYAVMMQKSLIVFIIVRRPILALHPDRAPCVGVVPGF